MNSTKNGDHVVIESLHLSYQRWGQRVNALDGVSLSVPRGQWLILVGHNGSGKTSLLRVLSGRAVPDCGHAKINGKAAREMNAGELAESVFLIHQDPLLGTAADLTVLENLAVADSHAASESKRSLQGKYVEMLNPVGLADRMKQPVQTLSGGERQLLALLIARLRPASLILLDEPLAALDPSKAERCLAEIADLRKAGKTIIQVTHDPELASTLGDRTVVMRAGKIVHDANLQARNVEALRSHWF
ncbi:MAG: ATP-binding cassette domain-containing protein [Verrucomicrobiota bacterium]